MLILLVEKRLLHRSIIQVLGLTEKMLRKVVLESRDIFKREKRAPTLHESLVLPLHTGHHMIN